jgi:hypothetical protein
VEGGFRPRQRVLHWLRKNVELLVRLGDEWYPPPSNPVSRASVEPMKNDIVDASLAPQAVDPFESSDDPDQAPPTLREPSQPPFVPKPGASAPQPYHFTHMEHEFERLEKTLEERGQMIAGLQAEVEKKERMVRDMLDRLSWEIAPDREHTRDSNLAPPEEPSATFLGHRDSDVLELEAAKQELESERHHRARMFKRVRSFLVELRSLLEVTHTEQFLTSGRPTGAGELVVSTEYDPESEFVNTPLRAAIQLQRTNKMLQSHIEHLSREVLDRDVLIKSLLAQIDERDTRLNNLAATVGQESTER